jgi:hypothetical protein
VASKVGAKLIFILTVQSAARGLSELASPFQAHKPYFSSALGAAPKGDATCCDMIRGMNPEQPGRGLHLGPRSRGLGYGRAIPLAAMASQPPAYARTEGSAMATVDESFTTTPVEPHNRHERRARAARTDATDSSPYGKTIAALRRDAAALPLEITLLSGRQVARALSVSEQTVWRYAKRGLLTAIKLATSGDPARAPRRYRASEVQALIGKFAAGAGVTE